MFGAKEMLPERKAVDEMKYTLSTLKESLRKYTVVPVVVRRVGTEEGMLCGHRLPKDTMVVLSLQVKAMCIQCYLNGVLTFPALFLNIEYEAFCTGVFQSFTKTL